MNRFQRIVLVDDNDADNFYHRMVLERAGFTGVLQAFEDPREALQELTAGAVVEPTLVLLDINMPQMDGFTFARALGAAKARQTLLTVVMLTSSNSDEDRATAQGIPQIDGYVVKPLLVNVAGRLFEGIFET